LSRKKPLIKSVKVGEPLKLGDIEFMVLGVEKKAEFGLKLL